MNIFHGKHSDGSFPSSNIFKILHTDEDVLCVGR